MFSAKNKPLSLYDYIACTKISNVSNAGKIKVICAHFLQLTYKRTLERERERKKYYFITLITPIRALICPHARLVRIYVHILVNMLKCTYRAHTHTSLFRSNVSNKSNVGAKPHGIAKEFHITYFLKSITKLQILQFSGNILLFLVVKIAKVRKVTEKVLFKIGRLEMKGKENG